jgi:hypothetical protein
MTGSLARRAAATIRQRAWVVLLLIGGAIGVLALVAASLAGLAANPGSRGVSRVEVQLPGIGARCKLSSCPLVFTRSVLVRTPSDVDSVDVVVTVTAVYSVTRGDSAWTAVGHRDPDAPPPPCPPPQPGPQPLWVCGSPMPMTPDAYPIDTPRGEQRPTTLTWFTRDLPAAGRSYAFSFGVSPHDANGDHRSSVVAQRVVLVAETWSAGD